MKKYLLSSVALTALALMATSCSDEQAQDLKAGAESTVTFTAQLPGEMATRAFADGTKATELHYAVYEKDTKTRLAVCKSADGSQAGLLEGTATMTGLQTTISLQLTTGKEYDFVFWAAKPGNAVYTFDSATQTVSVNSDELVNNSDDLDAFFTHDSFKVDGNKQINEELRRPFAQINIGTDDFEAAKASGFEMTMSAVSVASYKTLNLLTEAVADAYTAELKAAVLPTENTLFAIAGKDYKYLSMSYALVPADKETVDVKFDYSDKNNTTFSRTFANVPVQRNYRTNIYGSLLTNTVDFNVEIKPAFETPDYVLTPVATATQLLTVAATGGTAKLEAPLDLGEVVKVTGDKNLTVDLNGNNVSNTVDLWDAVPGQWSLFSAQGGATLTLSGDGDVAAKANDCYAVDVQGGSHLVIEGGHYVGNIHAVYVEEGVAEIKGGTFEVQQTYPQAGKEYEFVLNCLDAHRANGTAKIIVTGGTFIGFNPADNFAEGAHTNFVATGYKSVEDGTTASGLKIWKVVAE